MLCSVAVVSTVVGYHLSSEVHATMALLHMMREACDQGPKWHNHFHHRKSQRYNQCNVARLKLSFPLFASPFPSCVLEGMDLNTNRPEDEKRQNRNPLRPDPVWALSMACGVG
jgi:hypothetical protein